MANRDERAPSYRRGAEEHEYSKNDRTGSRQEYRNREREERDSGRRTSRRSLSPARHRSSRADRRSRSPDRYNHSPDRRDGRDRADRPREIERHRSETSPARHLRSRPRSQSPPVQSVSLSQPQAALRDEEPEPNEAPNFAPSGKLAAETKTVNGVVLKYHEPPEARKPSKNWRLYVFKGKEQLDVLHVHRQSAYLFGRDRLVVDIPIDHPSSSKQHAVLQFRLVQTRNEFGDTKSLVKPFIIDLESANATFVNGEKIPQARYFGLESGDVIKFGLSTREYVLIPET
ncbi:SMAD/FHA domain-containing protein [Melampsora americana]|nr:SMAD/FHA domain-containing protein [Melampsora americana]